MEQSASWEVNGRSAIEEIPHLLWNPKVHCHGHKGLSMDAVLDQMNSVPILISYLCKLHFSIILPSTPQSGKLKFIS
jgi:hypothetical protein